MCNSLFAAKALVKTVAGQFIYGTDYLTAVAACSLLWFGLVTSNFCSLSVFPAALAVVVCTIPEVFTFLTTGQFGMLARWQITPAAS
jgi:hypothetical protein